MRECEEENNNNTCTPKILLEILYNNSKIAPADYDNYKKNNNALLIAVRLEDKYHYNISDMGIYGWLVKANGEKLNSNGLLSSSSRIEFKLNNEKVELSKKYADILEEERNILYPE